MNITDSGLKYEDTKKMKGKIISKNDLIRVNYKVALKFDNLIHSKNLIDSSDDHAEPIIIKAFSRMLLKGVDEGLTGMCIGDTRRLVVPPKLGYGSRGVPGIIPSNATLYIEINVSTKTD